MNDKKKIGRSKLNRELFQKAKEIMEANTHPTVVHIGWYSVSKFIDYGAPGYR